MTEKRLAAIGIVIIITAVLLSKHFWPSHEPNIYIVGIDKYDNKNLYITNSDFINIEPMFIEEKRMSEIAVHSDGSNIILLFTNNDYRQSIGQFSIKQREINNTLVIDEVLELGYRIIFFDWDVSENKLIIATEKGIDMQSYFDFNIQTLDISTNEIKTIFTANQDYFYYRRPMYSYNGKDEIVFDVDGKIYMVTISTGEIEFIAFGNNPLWTPDGNRITYFKDCGNYQFSIYNYDVESGENEYINEGVFYIYRNGGISWSPDEKYIYYIEARGESDPVSIVRYNVATGTSRKFLQSNKRNIKMYPLFITNVYN